MRGKFKIFIAAVLAVVTAFAAFHVTAFAAGENGNYKMVAITFDDGPSVYTDRLLDALKERGAKATFFVLGNRAAKYADTVKRIIDEGHQLASHTYDHSNLARKSYGEILSQYNMTAEILNSLGGDGNYWVRPPYGSIDADVQAAAKEHGVPLICWSVDSLDWQYRNTAKTVNKIMRTTGDGSIILLHDIRSTGVNAAIQVIDRLMAKGYEFVTVEELLARRGVEVQNGAIYYNAPNKGINLGPETASPEYFDETKIQEHWGYSALKWSIDGGYVSAGEDGAYKPNKYFTRAEFVESLGKLYGVNTALYQTGGTAMFSDVSDDASYAPYVRWAVEKGIINGDGCGHFNPDSQITRQETAVCLERFVSNCKPKSNVINISGGTVIEEETNYREAAGAMYTDVADIAEWAVKSVVECSGSGLFTGCSDGTFTPYGNITRAQVATLLQRMDVVVKEWKFC